MKKLTITLTFAALVLAGCNEVETVQSVDWYKSNNAERLAIIEKCNANPGQLEVTPNCINAKTAANQLAASKRGYSKLTPFNPLEKGK